MKECSCQKCRGACEAMPGRFLPGEAEKTAEHLGLSLKELFDKKLGVNWWENGPGERETFFLAPATTVMAPGSEYPGNPRGRCIFLENGLCQIHPVKPFECREYVHTDAQHMIDARGEQIKTAWEDHQGQIRELLGREPEAEEYTPSMPWWMS